MSIRRAPRPESNYTIIRNEVFNAEMSAEALGVLTYLLSKPDDWSVSKAQLRSRFEIGRDKIDKILSELVELGFVSVFYPTENGRFANAEYTVYDAPCPEKPSTEKPLTVKPHLLIPDNNKSLKETKSCSKSLFSEFWDQYPRKVAKPSAERAYLKALRKYPHAQILAGTIRHSTAWRRDNQDPQFIPHPSTFLNDERFNDEPQTHKPVSRADERTTEIEKFKRLVGERFGACGTGEDPEEIIDIRPGNGYIGETQGGPGG